MSPQKKKIFLLLAGAALFFTVISLACNLPNGLQERFFGSEVTATATPAPTNPPVSYTHLTLPTTPYV